MSHMQQGEPYIPPFIRELMPNATEEEIAEAAQNLRGYLSALYRIFLRREARERRERAADSATSKARGRFGEGGILPPGI